MIEGLLTVLGVEYVIYLFVGVLVGITVGALPGFTATMGTALVLPFTFTLDTGVGIGMLGGLYVAAMYSDAIPACLVNTPGTPSAMTTAFDGYPLTERGEGQKALIGAAFGSWVGATVGGVLFLLLAPPLAQAALRFGPPEFFWIGIFAVTIIGSIAGDSLMRGIAGGIVGMLVSTIGLSTTGAVTRYSFGLGGLRGGVSLVAGLIGIFALPQLLQLVFKRRTNESVSEVKAARGVWIPTVKEILRRPGNIVRSSLLGGTIGIVPAAGGPVAALVSYNEAVRWAKDRREFGKGSIHGVVASEAANSGAAGGAMVPLVALGVPGSAPAAVIMGALLLKGIQPGPRMFTTTPELVYGFAWSFIIAGTATFIVGSLLSRGMSKMVSIPVRLMVPIILLLSVIGSYAIRTNMMDVYAMVTLGILVYFLTKVGFHPGPIGLGLILGPIVEPALVQSISLTRASNVVNVFFARPLSIALILLSIASAAWAVYSNRRGKSLSDEEAITTTHEAPVGRSFSEAIYAAAACFAIAALFLMNSGTEVRDWVLPIMLSTLLIVCGIVFLGLAATNKGGPPVSIVPPILHGKGVDVAVVIAIMIAYVWLADIIGFWATSAIVVFGTSVYLTNDKNRKNVLISLAVAGLITVTLYFLMLEVFYVPFPRFFLT